MRVFKSLEDFFAGSAMKDSAAVQRILGVDDFPEKAKKVIENAIRVIVEVRGALLRHGLNGRSFDPLFKSVAPDTKKGDCNGVLEVPFSSSPPPPSSSSSLTVASMSPLPLALPLGSLTMCHCLLSLPHCFTPCELPLYDALDEEKMPKEVVALLLAAGISRAKTFTAKGAPVHKVRGIASLRAAFKWNYGVVFYHNLISLGSDAPNPSSAKRKADGDGGGAAKRGSIMAFLPKGKGPG